MGIFFGCLLFVWLFWASLDFRQLFFRALSNPVWNASEPKEKNHDCRECERARKAHDRKISGAKDKIGPNYFRKYRLIRESFVFTFFCVAASIFGVRLGFGLVDIFMELVLPWLCDAHRKRSQKLLFSLNFSTEKAISCIEFGREKPFGN